MCNILALNVFVLFSDPTTMGKDRMSLCTGPVATLNGHTGPVSGLAVTTNGHILVSASDDMTVIVWQLEEQMRVRRTIQTGHAE